jgi:hypothetical protein
MGNLRMSAPCQTGRGASQTAGIVRHERSSIGSIGKLGLLLLMAALLFVSTGRAWSQAQNTGSILGSVTDPNGLVIPYASVTAADTDKGITRTVTSNKTGEFLLPDLPVGNYILTVSAANFETYVQADVVIDPDKSVKIVAKLTVGSTKETVTVSGQGTGVDTDSATLKTIIDPTLVESLPIDGNNVVALAGLLPGVTDLNAPATNTSDRGGPTYSVSGSRNTQNLMLFDGLMWNNLFYNTGINYPPPLGLQEISVLLNNFKAQYGRNAGSVFNVITKSGTNQIHGAAWDYIQNKVFNASDYLSHINPNDTSNQYGFTVGGPIKVDKAYYQVTFQDLIQSLQVVGTDPVLGYAERGLQATCANGAPDIVGCSDGSTPKVTGRPCITPIYPTGNTCASFASDLFTYNPVSMTSNYSKLINPEQVSNGMVTNVNAENNFNSAWYQSGHTGTSPCIQDLNNAVTYAGANKYINGTSEPTYLPNAEIPSDCINPVTAAFNAKYVAFPNEAAFSSTNPNGVLTSVSTAPQPRHDINLLARVDYNGFSRHTIDARYNLIDANDATASGVNSSSVGFANYELGANSAVSNFGNIGDSWTITPNIYNVLRVGYKRYFTHSPPLDTTTWNSLGGNFVEPGSPVLPVVSASDFFTAGSAPGQALHNVVNENIEILEQIQYTRGNHNFQAGVNFLRLQYLNRTEYPGILAFSVTYTGLGIGDEVAGLLNSVQANSPLVQGGINHTFFGYIQDDWRVTSKLTLNLGARYELPFQWYQPNGYSSTFIPGHQSTVFPGAIGGLAYPGDPGVLNSLVPTDFNGIVPRLGFAYDVFGTGRLAIRGGFGMFFDAVNANVIGVGEPFYFQFYKQTPPGGASVPLATYGNNPSDTRPNGNVRVIPGAFDKTNPQFAAPYTIFFPDRNFRTPYYEAFNFGFQLRVTHGGVLDTNYVGKLGRKLTIPYDQNPAIVDCSGGYYQSNPQVYASPYCPYLVPGSTAGSATNSASSYQQRVRYTPFNYGGSGIVDFASIGTSNYNGLQIQYTQRGGRHFTLLASYAYSKAIDLETQSETTSNLIPNVFDITSERGASDYDARHVLNMGWVITLPKVTGGYAAERAILNDWIYGGKFSAHTGRPYNVTLNNDSALTDEPNQRASLVPGMSPKLPANRHRSCPGQANPCKLQQWFNPLAFTYPAFGTYGNQQRNSLYGPGYLLTDMNIGRYFPLSRIREGMRLLIRADAFNVWNTPNLANPQAKFGCSSTSIEQPGNPNYGKLCTQTINTAATGTTAATYDTYSSAQFGSITSTTGNNGNTSTNGRKMQFNVTVFF